MALYRIVLTVTVAEFIVSSSPFSFSCLMSSDTNNTNSSPVVVVTNPNDAIIDQDIEKADPASLIDKGVQISTSTCLSRLQNAHNEAMYGYVMRGIISLITLAGGATILYGAYLPQLRFSDYASGNALPLNYDIHFNKFMVKYQHGDVSSSASSALPECLRHKYTIAMAHAIVGSALALLVALPLNWICTTSIVLKEILRLICTAALFAAVWCALQSAEMSPPQNICDPVFDIRVFKEGSGPGVLIRGAHVTLLAACLSSYCYIAYPLIYAFVLLRWLVCKIRNRKYTLFTNILICIKNYKK